MKIWVNIGAGNIELPDVTKPFPDPMSTYHQRGPLGFSWWELYAKKRSCIAYNIICEKIYLNTCILLHPRSQGIKFFKMCFRCNTALRMNWLKAWNNGLRLNPQSYNLFDWLWDLISVFQRWAEREDVSLVFYVDNKLMNCSTKRQYVQNDNSVRRSPNFSGYF